MEGYVVLKYIPTGKIIRVPLKIKRMQYHNELIICDSFGYDKGEASAFNNLDNWELIHISAEPADEVKK